MSLALRRGTDACTSFIDSFIQQMIECLVGAMLSVGFWGSTMNKNTVIFIHKDHHLVGHMELIK